LGAGRGAYAHGLIGKAHVQAFLIGSRVYCNGFDAHFFAGADYTQGNFSPVGYQYLFKHELEFEIRN
jgi:hypothetical protein